MGMAKGNRTKLLPRKRHQVDGNICPGRAEPASRLAVAQASISTACVAVGCVAPRPPAVYVARGAEQGGCQ